MTASPVRNPVRMVGRRDVLKAAAFGAVGAALPLSACGGPAPTTELTVTPLADGLILVSGAGGNVVAARGVDGVVMIDGGLAEHAETLVRAVTRELGQRDVAALFNTHWHLEQTGANALLGKQGVKILAHENTRLWMTTDIYRRWEDKTYPRRPVEEHPTETFYGDGSMAIDGDTIEYGYMRFGHTDGDIYLRLPAANVIVAGGPASNAGWPLLDWSTGGWLGGMIDALTRISAMSDDATKIVPADGPVMTKADVDGQITMYQTILDRMAADLRASLGPDEMAAKTPTAEFDALMGDPTQFVTLAYQSCWAQIRTDRRVGAI